MHDLVPVEFSVYGLEYGFIKADGWISIKNYRRIKTVSRGRRPLARVWADVRPRTNWLRG